MIDFCMRLTDPAPVALNMPGGGSLHPAHAETVAARRCTMSIRMARRFINMRSARWRRRPADCARTPTASTASDLDVFIPHQANKRIIMSTADRLGMPPESVIINIDRYGNTTAATIPLAMQTALKNTLKGESLVLLASVGAGLPQAPASSAGRCSLGTYSIDGTTGETFEPGPTTNSR